jgi:hypothetical protein
MSWKESSVMDERLRFVGKLLDGETMSLPPQIESLIVALKRDKPHWGARKIRELLVRRLDHDIRIPAKTTIHAVLHRHGLVKPIGRPRHRATGTPLSRGSSPNELWCADFKGDSSWATASAATRQPSPITPRATARELWRIGARLGR